MRLKLYRGAHL